MTAKIWANHARMRPSRYGFTCYMLHDDVLYQGHGTTMEAAYSAFLQHGNDLLMERAGLGEFETRVRFMNVRRSLALHERRKSPKIPDHCVATANLPWWKRLFRI